MALNLNEPDLNNPNTPKHLVKWTREVAKNLFDEMQEWFYNNPDAFMLKQFTVYKKIDSNILGDLYNKYPENKPTINLIKEMCEVRMLEKGLTGKYRDVLTIFALKNNHNYTDKQEVIMTNNDNLKIKIPGIKNIEVEDITGQKRLEE